MRLLLGEDRGDRDIAAKTLDGTVPTRRGSARLSDAEMIERLVSVRGVGRWTVEMLLIFTLGRPDVLPVDDFGVRNGFRLAFDLDEMPKPKEVLAYGERWKPYAHDRRVVSLARGRCTEGTRGGQRRECLKIFF